MTIKELRKIFTKRVEHLCEPSLKDYYEVCWRALETLYEVGELNVRKNYYIPDEIMSLARAYESGRKIRDFTVVQSLDLMYIYATKKQARDLMGMFLGLETEQTAKPEPTQLEETAAESEQEKAESEAPEHATAETAQDAEPEQYDTASIKCGGIEIKPTTTEQAGYINRIQSVEQMGKTRYMFTVSDDFCVELIICEHDIENKNDLMNHWYQHGYVKERNATHMGLHCYYTDFDGNCYGRYNPTENKGKLNFEWVMPYSPENLGKLLAEAIKRYDDDSELVIVDVSSEFPHIYTIVKSGENWIESINSAYKDAHESAEICRQHMKNHPDNADYWKARVEEYERVYYRAMRYSDFERIQRERILKQPLHEVTEQDYEEMLDVLPPLHWVEINGVSEFCMMEMYTGCYTNQYAHDKKTGKYYQKLVDATDRDTWIHKLLEKGVA